MAKESCPLLHRMMATEPRHITLGSPLSNETTPTRLGLPYTSDCSVQKRKLACRTLYKLNVLESRGIMLKNDATVSYVLLLLQFHFLTFPVVINVIPLTTLAFLSTIKYQRNVFTCI
jgi:hypothetical protein